MQDLGRAALVLAFGLVVYAAIGGGLGAYTRRRRLVASARNSLFASFGATAVASIIGFVELTRAGQLMTNATFQPMIVYPIVAGLYFALCWPLSLWAQYLEKQLRVENVMGRRK